MYGIGRRRARARAAATLARPVLGGLLVTLLWALPEVALLEMRPLPASLGLTLLTVAFVYTHWVRAAGAGRPAKREALRLRPLGAALPAVVGGVAVYLLFDHAFWLVYLGLASVPPDEPFLAMYPYGRETIGWLPVLLAGVVLGPAVEETAFRGWIQRPLERAWGPRAAIGASALLFAVAHGTAALVPYYFVTGLVLGAAVYAARSLWAGIALHTAANATTLGWELVGVDQAAQQALAVRPGVRTVAAVSAVLAAALLVGAGRRVHASARARCGPGGPA